MRFYSEPAERLQQLDADNASIAGEWNAQKSSISLAYGAVESPTVVRHEMLHALLVAGGHPADKFAGTCAGYVNCEGACAEAAGQPRRVSADAPRLAMGGLRITQRLVPSSIDFAADPDGWFALVIEVTNPLSHDVQVPLNPFPGRPEIAATLGYASDRTAHNEYVEGSLLPLRAGETRRAVFDLRAKDFIAENGSARIRGFFNTNLLPELRLNVQ